MNKKFKKNNRTRAFNQYDPEKHPLPKVQEIAEESQREVPTHFPGELEELERQARREGRQVEIPEVPVDPSVEIPPVVPVPDPNEVPTDPVITEVPLEEPPVEEEPLELPVEEERPLEDPAPEVPAIENPEIETPIEDPVDPEKIQQ